MDRGSNREIADHYRGDSRLNRIDDGGRIDGVPDSRTLWVGSRRHESCLATGRPLNDRVQSGYADAIARPVDDTARAVLGSRYAEMERVRKENRDVRYVTIC